MNAKVPLLDMYMPLWGANFDSENGGGASGWASCSLYSLFR
jgi:hypothetical protein